MLFNFKKHNMLWDYIITHPKIPKKDVYYILFGDDAPEIPNYCFACNAVYDQFCKIRCEHCPLEWPLSNNAYENNIFFNCEDIAKEKPCVVSYYGNYLVSFLGEEYESAAYYAYFVRTAKIKSHWKILDEEWALCNRQLTCL